MISTMWTKAPADLLGRGGTALSAADAARPCGAYAEPAVVRLAAPTAPSRGTGLPAGSASVRLRPDTRQALDGVGVTGTPHQSTTFENNVTTLGYHAPGRPLS